MARQYRQIEQDLFAEVARQLKELKDPTADRVFEQMEPTCVSEIDVLQVWLAERLGTRVVLGVADDRRFPALRVVIAGLSRETHEPPHTPSAEELRELQPHEFLAYGLRRAMELHERYESGSTAVLLPLGKPAL